MKKELPSRALPKKNQRVQRTEGCKKGQRVLAFRPLTSLFGGGMGACSKRFSCEEARRHKGMSVHRSTGFPFAAEADDADAPFSAG